MSHWENNGKSDEWYTPKYVFDALDCTFHVDVAAPKDRTHCHVPAEYFITENSLDSIWYDFVWMNPPFGGRNGLIPWLNRINQHGNGIALTPDRTSAPWWQQAAKQSNCHLQVTGKIKFIDQNGNIGIKPGNGTTLFAYGERAVKALLKAQENKLGMVFKSYLGENES